jgi:tetratricopeptide (TPR) repeat protein
VRVRRPLAVIIALVAVSALAFLWWSAPGGSRDAAASDAGAPAPPLPDLSRLDQSAQQQLRERHAELVARLDDGRASPSQRADAFGSLGMVLFATEYWAEAEQALLHAQALAPEDRRWPYYLGQLYRARQEPARAIAMFERVLTIAPDDVPATTRARSSFSSGCCSFNRVRPASITRWQWPIAAPARRHARKRTSRGARTTMALRRPIR